MKRKNSTSCNPPEARLTVVGSVAWRAGPREVAIGCASTGGVADNSSSMYVAVRSTVGVDSTTGTGLDVALGSSTDDCVGAAVDGAEVHAARKTASRLRRKKRPGFVMCILPILNFQSPCITKSLPNY